MEKYEKPVMILEEIEDEVYTIDAGAALIVSEEPPQEPIIIN